MRVRWGLGAIVLTGTVLLTAYEAETTSARAVSGQPPDASFSDATVGAPEGIARTLAPGRFIFTTGLDKVPQHIQGPVACDTEADSFRIAIGDPDGGGVEIGLSTDESTLQYVDLGYRNGVNLMLRNDGETDRTPGQAPPTVRKTGNTYFASGYATGLTSTNRDTSRYFEIFVTCP